MTDRIKIPCNQYGGKTTLAKWIISNFPEHKIYCEPFCGSASILFSKPKSFIEIINDLDGRFINVFKKIREEPEKLAALLWATPYSNANWREIEEDPNELEKARLFIAERCQFFCGNVNTSTWAIDTAATNHKPKPEVWADWFLRILPAANRLRNVEILQEDAIITIKRVCHKEEALLYIDPPYLGHENEYKYRANYEEMVSILLNQTKAKVVVSEYEEANKYFGNWRQVNKEKVISVRRGTCKKEKIKNEILFMNF